VGKRANYLQYFCRKILVKRPLGRHKHRGRIILKCILKKEVGAWTGLNKNKWRTPVNTVINFGVP